MHYAVDEGIGAEALHSIIGLWEANTDELTFASLVEEGKPSSCAGCGLDVTPYDEDGRPSEGAWEWYMVQDEIWRLATRADDVDIRYLCIGCLEQRLARTLVPADFGPWDVNKPSDLTSPRLRRRLPPD